MTLPIFFLTLRTAVVSTAHIQPLPLYKLSADQGHVTAAMINLGVMYINGQGVGQSNQMAREWLVKAAEQGDETAVEYLEKIDAMEGNTKRTTTTTPTPKPTRVCATCNTPQPPNHKYQCCICRSVYYCSTKCQRKHWLEHKKQHRIEIKSRVRLVNLKTVAMNGKCGSRREWNEDKGRFVVHLDDGRIVNVKPENLESVR